MPQAVQADWELIRELYRNGLSPTEIAQKTGVQSGTIASRASRGQWKAIAAKAKSIVQVEIKTDSGNSHLAETNALSKHSTLINP